MTTYALHFPPYIPVTLKEHYFSDVPAPTAGDDGKALTYRHSLTDYVYTSFEAAGAAAAAAAAAATALATHTGVTSGVHGIAAFGATLNATASQAAAQTALGLVIGTNVQAQNVNLAAIAGLTTAANKVEYWTGSGVATLADFTSYGRGLVASANVAATGLLAADGSVMGATGSAQTLTNGVVLGLIAPPSDSTTAINFYQSDKTTKIVIIDTMNRNFKLSSPAVSNRDVGPNQFSIFDTAATPIARSGAVYDASASRFFVSSPDGNAQFRIEQTNTASLFRSTSNSLTFQGNGASGTVQFTADNSAMYMVMNPDGILVFNGSSDTTRFIIRASSAQSTTDIFQIANSSGTKLAGFSAVGALAVGHINTATAWLDAAASTTARASLRIRNGTWPTTPNDGDIANDGNALRFMLNGTNAVNTDGGLSVWMQSSLNARNVGRLLWQYTDKTDATRKSEGAVTAFDGATEYKAIRWGANGAAMLGVLGAAPAVRQVVTGSKTTGAALVSLLAALVTFGWITDSTTA